FYATDGTYAGTRALTTGGGTHFTNRWTVANDFLVTGDFWRFDLTPSLRQVQPNGTVVTGSEGGRVVAGETAKLAGPLLYAAATDTLWRTDGTDAGTFELAPLATLHPFGFGFGPQTPCF